MREADAPERYACLCCGFFTLPREPPGTFELCPVCFWEDCPMQAEDVDYEGGANMPSLRQARENFRAFGACEHEAVAQVRAPRPEEIPPNN